MNDVSLYLSPGLFVFLHAQPDAQGDGMAAKGQNGRDVLTASPRHGPYHICPAHVRLGPIRHCFIKGVYPASIMPAVGGLGNGKVTSGR